MDEYEAPATNNSLTERSGDVDDFIFHNDPEWYVSER